MYYIDYTAVNPREEKKQDQKQISEISRPNAETSFSLGLLVNNNDRGTKSHSIY